MNNKMVRKANHLIEASYKLSALEQKIIALMASTIKPDDADFTAYPIRIRDFQSFTGTASNNYERLEDVVVGLKEKNIKIVYTNDEDKKVILNVSWLSSSKYTEGSGVIELCFDPTLKPFFLQLKARFTKYKLKNVVQLKSQFSIRIYELLKQYEKIGQRLFSLADLRSVLGVEDGQYKLYADFKRKVLLVAQEELTKKTDLSFSFEEIKIGHSIGQVRFYIKSQDQEKTQLAEAEDVPAEPVPHENAELDRLMLIMPEGYREKESLRKLLKGWLEKKGFDYVSRNIEYANDGSNAVKPGTSAGRGSNYRAYLSKALGGDFGLPYKEDNEAKMKAQAEAQQKAQEAAKAEQETQEQTEKEKEDNERARIFQESLSQDAIENLQAEAFSRLSPEYQDLVSKKTPGSNRLLKLMMNKIVLERMRIS